jgi:catechol 2,3-dioxygenase-like lactoylglutathione lyase family enzyme
MTVQLDHTIVTARDAQQAASFLAELLGMPAPVRSGPFLAIRLDNGVTLDYYAADREFVPAHYAFRLDPARFDAVLARLRERGIAHWADPFHRIPDTIYQDGDTRGVYFEDPSGHNMEVLAGAA